MGELKDTDFYCVKWSINVYFPFSLWDVCVFVCVHGCASVSVYMHFLSVHAQVRGGCWVSFSMALCPIPLAGCFNGPEPCHFNEASWPLTSSYIPWSMGTHSHAWLFTWMLRVQTQVLLCAQLTNKLSLPLAHLLLFLQGRKTVISCVVFINVCQSCRTGT